MNQTSALPREEPTKTVTVSARSWQGWCNLADNCTDTVTPEEFMEVIGLMSVNMQLSIDKNLPPMERFMELVRSLRAPTTQIHASGNSQVAVHGGTIVNATFEEHHVPPDQTDAVVRALLQQPSGKPPPFWAHAALAADKMRRQRKKK